jgi:hypothetical protein
MEEQLITLETAKIAKEKGFKLNHGCDSYYVVLEDSYLEDHYKHEDVLLYSKGQIKLSSKSLYNTMCENVGDAPSQSILQKWLRDEHNIDIEISVHLRNGGRRYRSDIFIYGFHDKEMEEQETYEDALEEGLQEALKLIK